MTALWSAVMIKACLALVLALVAAGLGRYLKRPSLVHLLWIVVLLELLVPPLYAVGVLPRVELPSVMESSSLGTATWAVSPPPAGPEGAPAIPTDDRRTEPLAFAAVAAAIWAAGAAFVLGLVAVRLRRFARSLVHASDPPAEMVASGDRLARRLGLARCPRIRLVPAPVSPMLRPRLGSLEVLFPVALLPRLTRRERDALLAHELAHVRRGDHWVRLVELASGALFWWHPVVWWARTRLRRLEEQCCDGLVLETLPRHAGDYASGLVKTLEFLAAERRALPSLASGVGGTRILKERLTMILERRPTKNLSRAQRWFVFLAAGALLVVLPTWAERTAEPPEPRETETREVEIRESVIALEREAQRLEDQLHDVRIRQHELEAELRREHGELELERLELEAAAIEAQGDVESAERLLQEREWMQQSIELEQQRESLERDVEREMARREAAVRELAYEAEQHAVRGDRARAEQLERKARELSRELERTARRHEGRHREIEEFQVQMELDRMREQIVVLREAGRDEEAAELAAELARVRREYDVDARERESRDVERALHEELSALRLEAERLESLGRDEDVALMERRIEELERALERERVERSASD